MNKSDKKAERYIKDNKVFPLKNTTSYKLWGVEGDSGVHTVRYDKLKMIYSCNCNNIRFTDCSHIKCILIKDGDNNEEKV